jgi:transposase
MLSFGMKQPEAILAEKFSAISSSLNEKSIRLWAAAEAKSMGRGGIQRVANATGISRDRICRGIRELDGKGGEQTASGAIRRKGGGRKKLSEQSPGLLEDLKKLVDPVTRGHPESPLLWTAKSTATLAEELQGMGHQISDRSVAALLKEAGYSLQAMRKTKEGGEHEDRDAQFAHIAASVNLHQSQGQPAVSIDAKKKELIGTFANKGREWQPKGCPEEANVYDFIDKKLGKVTPYGVYDLLHNQGWVSVGIDHDTAEFAVESLRRWWREMGSALYPGASKLLITADGGGSNGSRVRLWKVALQEFARETGLEIQVCHYPPGTSKWNKIEHRMFNHISMNWRGRALAMRQTVVSLIGQTTTKAGLKIMAELDEGVYPTGIKVSDEEMRKLNITPAEFQPRWNYTLRSK